MINSDAKLNSKIFDADVEQRATREGYGEGLLIAGAENPNVVVLSADLTESTRAEAFSKKFPDRFFEMGVAEQNMAAVAAGLGVSGKIPFISSYSTFSPGRNWEQIRTTICYNDSNVKIAAHHAGIMTGPDGATHQNTEDIAIMRVLPNMRVFVPCDMIEAKKATIAAAKLWGPTYIRFARDKSAVFTTEQTPFEPGRALLMWKSIKPQVAIISCGFLTHNALKAARELEKEKINVIVINMPTVKPLDEKAVVEAAKKCGAEVTVEEHQIYGGLGGAVAEVLARKYPTPMEFIGMKDTFGESGAPYELVEKYGMGVKDIVKAVKKVVGRKSKLNGLPN